MCACKDPWVTPHSEGRRGGRVSNLIGLIYAWDGAAGQFLGHETAGFGTQPRGVSFRRKHRGIQLPFSLSCRPHPTSIPPQLTKYLVLGTLGAHPPVHVPP